MNQKKIGKRISEKRKLKKLTQQELANKLNITNRTIINWENGKCYPDYALLLPLCEELDISINELLTGEEVKEQKANATTELILDYLDRNRNENLNEYKKYGKILLIGGIFLMIIGVQIPLDLFEGRMFLDSVTAMYPVIGLIFAFIGFKFINKKHHFKKRIILNSIFLISCIIFLIISDIISITFYNRIPRYYTNDVTNEGSEGIIYLETPFYDAYACYDWNFKIIPLSIKRYDNNDADYLRDKYCNHINYENGGDN
ncbi:MAG: helix-turn-helix domain-containing protein [Firmicutes bacterium]|nr:helix-turn-helix domain-containing protein [Bacillota bacterium]